ncbi:MAG: helix-turn-helix domain-containing protein [Oscillospiraceae bacterium]|nr:helix-turn-helix domain-containing protein [Oscillospiraceae bacterium]
MKNKQLAEMIKFTCKRKKSTISQMLIDCKIRKSFIYDLEKRDLTPSVATVEAIADYLDCSVDYLLGRTDNPNSHKN